MIARASQLFLPTLRDAPADAEAVSHKLLVRGGYIRQMSAGLWTYLPLGWRVHQNVVAIVREEMDAIGSQEMLAPVLTPAELWEETGRYGIPELFKLEDRAGRRFVLPLTHEESFTFHARELQSYRQLPQMLYHFQTKDRDEPRPRGGLLRVREFVMKDAYSFDVDDEGLARSFELQRGAYYRIFDRCGLEFYEVEAESGMMGGKESLDFLSPVRIRREHARPLRARRLRGRPRDRERRAAAGTFPDRSSTGGDRDAGHHDDRRARRAARDRRRRDLEGDARTREDGTVVLALVRGDDRLSDEKLGNAVGNARAATEDEIRAAFGADPGLARARRLRGRDRRRRGAARGPVRGRREPDRLPPAWRRARPRLQGAFADLREAREGDSCPSCGGALRFQTAIEVGHIFKLGTFYSEPLGATVLDEDGAERPIVMGSYGIGPGRIVAAVVEQGGDEDSIVWPAELAPYDAEVVSLDAGDLEILAKAEEAAQALG